jgi:hypothetical protein
LAIWQNLNLNTVLGAIACGWKSTKKRHVLDNRHYWKFDISVAKDERYLAGVDGMNAFSAAAILSQISLRGFLKLRPDQRLELAIPIPGGMMVGVGG